MAGPGVAEADPGIFAQLPAIPEVAIADAAALDARLSGATAPFVVRGLVREWPLVAAGSRSASEARAYLLAKARDLPFTVSVGQPTTDGGRLFYEEADGGVLAMNFRTLRAKLGDIFAQIEQMEGRPDAPPVYLASVDVKGFFQGLHEANHVDLGDRQPLGSIWIGTRTRVAAHNDAPANLACVAAGRRRFTLFPRDQFRNLYLGPVDNTPAGRPVSMVDFHAPDLDRFPRFAEALAHGQVADLNAGDAIYIPSMWWHHVEALAPFNILVNYWWRETPRWLGNPQDALNLAMMAVRDLPAADREHWRDLFDFYVFGDAAAAAAHIPEGGRGVLGAMTPESAGRMRAYLLRQLQQ